MTTDRNRYIKHIHPFFGHREPGSITHIDIETFKKEIEGLLTPKERKMKENDQLSLFGEKLKETREDQPTKRLAISK